MTGLARPRKEELPGLVTPRAPELDRFEDDGRTPNNAALPLVIYRAAVAMPRGLDPAAIFEELFAANEWPDSWRNGIYDFLHFHTSTHEVLGIARGRARVQFGGDRGRAVDVEAGDVVVLPAGTGHRRIAASNDLLVVGAYPSPGGRYDQTKPGDVDHDTAVRRIAEVPPPACDPVYGHDGPLMQAWRNGSKP
ncbi:MAG: cupin domain-containing protein [Enhydrobacter sp.]|nr:cupin domain-containing protein [Enhydrobacter sp.]